MADSNLITPEPYSPGVNGPPPNLNPLSLLRWAAKHPPSDPAAVSFSGKTVLVTGANAGLGFQAALKYFRLGASRLILATRTLEKGQEAKSRLLSLVPSRAHEADSIISVIPVNMDTFDSVIAFISQLERQTETLDVALLNAGLGNPTYETAPTGWEAALQVNVLSTALMAVLLLPLLRKTAAEKNMTGIKTHHPAAHLTIVNSNGHDRVKKEWLLLNSNNNGNNRGYSGLISFLQDGLRDSKNWDAEKSYMGVKLAGMAVLKGIVNHLNNRHGHGHGHDDLGASANGKQKIIVTAVCPGLCKTELGRKFGFLSHLMMAPVQAFLARTAEEGSRSLVSASALTEEGHGRFWYCDVLYPFGGLANDDELMDKTWEDVVRILEKHCSRVGEILGRTV